jgi:hypothetical protein
MFKQTEATWQLAVFQDKRCVDYCQWDASPTNEQIINWSTSLRSDWLRGSGPTAASPSQWRPRRLSAAPLAAPCCSTNMPVRFASDVCKFGLDRRSSFALCTFHSL